MVLKNNPLHTAAKLFLSAFGIASQTTAKAVAPVTVEDRRSLYDYLWACYNNTLYDRIHYQGALDYVNETLGEAAALDLSGIFNPVERVVELYAQNVFNGNFADEIEVAPEIGTKRKRRAVNPRILDPLESIFNWSNLNIEKQMLTRYGANFGTCGIRIVAQVGENYPNDTRQDRRVYLKFEHPSTILGAIQDARGNITQTLTEHRRTEGDLDIKQGEQNLKTFSIRVLMTKQSFTTMRTAERGGDFTQPYVEAGLPASLPNALQVVPYVIAQHRKIGGLWGGWSFMGQMSKIDRLNALVAHINRQIFRHVNANFLVSGRGRAPKQFDFSGSSVLYQRKRPDDTTTLEVHALVTDLNLEHAIAEAKFILAELRDSMPELKATDGDFVSNQSGETIAHLRQPAEQRILNARTLYEDALIRALKIALSFGIMLGIFPEIGVQPNREAVDAAFRAGLFDFKFNTRDALPITENERLERAQKRADLADAEQERRINASTTMPEIDETDPAQLPA